MGVLGMLEFSSIAVGIHASDAMVKAAPIRVITSKPTDPGRYITLITGDVASVEASLDAGAKAATADRVVDTLFLPNAHDQILPALERKNPAPERDALGAIDTATVAAIIRAADAACKTSPVSILKLRYALHIGGKGYLTFVGTVADVEASLDSAIVAAGEFVLESRLIPNPYPDIFEHLVQSDDSR